MNASAALPVAVTGGSRRPICEVSARAAFRRAGRVRHLDPSRIMSWTVSSEPVGSSCTPRRTPGRDRPTSVRAAQLREPPAQREPGPDAPDEPRVGERAADVGDRRLRQAEPSRQLARTRRDAAVLGEQVEDRRRAGDRWCE
jgi:hypothetical protein